jgi:branched-chain amino acid transport system substrate-binding protein
MPIRNRMIVAIGAATAAVALAVGGCSSSSAGGSASSSAGGSASSSGGGASSASGSIPVGVIGSYSGPEASALVGTDKAVEAWADAVNAAGGLKGHKVKLFVDDDGGNTETGIQDVRELVQQDHVVAIVGEFSTPDSSWASYVQSQGVPVVGGMSVHQAFTTSPDFYAAGADYIDGSYGVVAQTAAKGGSKSLGAVYCAELPVCAGVVQLFDTLGKSVGVSVKYEGKIAQGTPDFTAVCQAMKTADATYNDVAIDEALTKQMFNQCASEGMHLPLISFGNIDSTYASDPAFNNLVEVDPAFPFWQDNTPATKAFHAALAKYEPSVGASATSPLTPLVAQAWASGALFEAAVNAAGRGPITAASVKRGLYALKNETLGGLTGPLNFTQGQPNLEHCSFAYTIENGKFTSLDGLKPTCAPPATTGPIAAAISK